MAITDPKVLKDDSLHGKGADELIRTAWSKDIQYESLQHDAIMSFPSLTGEIDPGKSKEVKPGMIFQDVSAVPGAEDAKKVVLQLTKSISGGGYTGSSVDDIAGNEQKIGVRYFSAFAADFSQGVPITNFGKNAREYRPTKIYSMAKPLLAQWDGENRGYYTRSALLQSISPNLAADTDLNLTQDLNSNSFIVGDDTFISLVDSTNAGDQTAYSTAVATALNGMNQTQADAAHLSVGKILNLVDVAADNYIKPISWKGYSLYVLYVSDEEFTRMINPEVAGSYSKYWVSAAALGDGSLNKVIPGASFVIGDSVVVVRDKRCALANANNTTTPTDVTFHYLLPGREDGRKTAKAVADKYFNANILVGESAVVKYNPEPSHYSEAKDGYKKYSAVGIWGSCGYMSPKWTDLNPYDASTNVIPQQESSMIVFTASKDGTFPA